MTRYAATTIQMAILAAFIAFIVWTCSGCTPHPVAYPISSSHTALTASEYDLAEAAFSGGLQPMPAELSAVRCQTLLEKRDNISAVMIGMCSATGAGGLAVLIPKDATEDERKAWDIGLGATTLALGVTCTTLGAVVRNLSAEFESQCGTKPAPVETVEVSEHPASDEVEQDGGVD